MPSDPPPGRTPSACDVYHLARWIAACETPRLCARLICARLIARRRTLAVDNIWRPDGPICAQLRRAAVHEGSICKDDFIGIAWSDACTGTANVLELLGTASTCCSYSTAGNQVPCWPLKEASGARLSGWPSRILPGLQGGANCRTASHNHQPAHQGLAALESDLTGQ